MKKLLVIFMVLAFVAPAMAAEWNFYGSARMTYIYYDRDEEQALGTAGDTDGVNDDTDLRFDLQGNSRIGARVKASDAVSGRFEWGVSSSNVGTRLLYGVWNFGSGKLTVGQDYSPIYTGISNQIGNSGAGDDSNLLATGVAYNSRDPQIKFTFGDFQLAFLRNEGGGIGAFSSTDTLFPRVEAAYTFKTDAIMVKPFAGFQTYDVETVGVGQDDETVTSYVLGASAKLNFGAAYVNACVYYAQNPANFGMVLAAGGSSGAGAAIDASGDIEDASGYGAALVAGFKINDMVKLEAGIGMISFDVDDTAAAGDVEDDSMSYYVQLPITLAKGVFIIPEIGAVDDDKIENDLGVADQEGYIYYGLKMQINF